MENFDDAINRVLLGAAIVSIVIGLIQHGFPEGLLEGTSIMIALCIIIVVGSGNNYMSELKLAELVCKANEQEVAIYNSAADTVTKNYELLVVGDVIQV